MSIRISQRQMYSSFIYQMNTNLSDLMESNLQGSSEKKVNRPSDDPAGAARILLSRATLNNIGTYQKNVDTANGWLSYADATLIQVQEVLAKASTVAEQGSSETYIKENREIMSDELRQLFGKLIGLSNSEFGQQHIFSGHKTGQAAFVEGLYATSNDPAMAAYKDQYVVEGGSAATVVMQFTSTGAVGAGTTFRYSSDGGKTWTNGAAPTAVGPPQYPTTSFRFDAGGASVVIPDTASVTAIVDPDNPHETNNGTWMYLRPTAIYQGDDHDLQVTTKYGGAAITAMSGEGNFTRDVSVRIDDATGPPMKYSYSFDDGDTWAQGTAPVGSPYRLPVPGGFVNITGVVANGDQVLVHPHRAEIGLEIAPNEVIGVNHVGKDIFGGIYKAPFADLAQPVYDGGSRNVFEVMGRLIAYAETGSADGMAKGLAELKECMKHVLTKTTEIGGKVNRLEVVGENLEMRKYNESANMSRIEDVDVTELMTRLAQQQLAYNAVLKSSSMIMQMSLMNFI